MKVSRLKGCIIILLIGIPMLIFSSALNIMSYRQMMTRTYVHLNNLEMTGVVSKINYALEFGKPLEKFYGLDDILESASKQSSAIESLIVSDTDGKMIETVGKPLSELPEEQVDEEYTETDAGIYSYIPLETGQLVLCLDKSQMDDQTSRYIYRIARLDVFILIVMLGVIIICMMFANKDGITVKRLKLIGPIIIFAALVAQGTYSTMHSVNDYQSSVVGLGESLAGIVQNDMNEVIDKGVSYQELTGVDTYLSDLIEDVTEMSGLTIADSGEHLGASQWVHRIQLDDKAGTTFQLVCQINQKEVRQKIINNSIDIIILLLITFFISLEIINCVTGHYAQREGREKGQIYMPGFRLFVFVSGVAFSLDSGFISILSSRLYARMDLTGNHSFLSGLPNTMYSLAIVLGLFLCSLLISKLGMKRTVSLGLFMGTLGYLLCAVANVLPMLIVARFIFGFCDGLVINAIRMLASTQESQEMHNKILVTYLATINLGVCCGVVIGGLVADASSYSIVFLIGALLGILCLILVPFAGFSDDRKAEKTSFADAVKQLRIPRVLFYMVFLIVPIYIATLFVGYTFPLYGDEIGLSNSVISACLMINYMVIAYLTDPISAWISKRLHPKRATIIYVILQAISIGIFVAVPNLWTAVLALVLTSIWDSFGMVVLDSALDGIEGAVTERSTQLQLLFGKVAMVIGPLVVTMRLSSGAAAATLSIVVALFAGLVIYGAAEIILNRKEKKCA